MANSKADNKKVDFKKTDSKKKSKDNDYEEEEGKDGGPKEDGVTDVNDVRPILGLCCLTNTQQRFAGAHRPSS